MKTRAGINYVICGIAALCLLLSTGANAAKSVQVKVQGQDDSLVDRQAIQDAIDSAPGEDLTIKLQGTFQLDGADIIVDRSNLTIKGDKKGALLKGKLGLDGLPINDIDNFPNRGFHLLSADPLENIEIKDLALTGFRTPIMVRAKLNSTQNVSIKNNSVENSFFGVSVNDQASDIRIVNNYISGVTNTGIIVQSSSSGDVSDLSIVDNYIADAFYDAITLVEVVRATIQNNFLSTADVAYDPAPFFAFGQNSDILVKGNTIQGGAVGLWLDGDPTGFTITQNCIRDGGTQGFPGARRGGVLVGEYFLSSASGFEIFDNSYQGNFAGSSPVPSDVWLGFNSNNNMVTERTGTVVFDDGVSNSVLVQGEGGGVYCDG